jgi:hypothetical protein
MKFKQLLQKLEKPIMENSGEHTNGGGLFIGDPNAPTLPSALTDKGTFNIKLPRSLDAINALLYGLSQKDYIDPDSVLNIVKQKLNHFGFDFEYKNALNDGENTFKLFQYGSPQLGVYGQNPYEDVNKTGFSQGDGIKDKLGHGLNLSVNIVKQPNMLRKVQLIIVPDNGGDENCGCMH